MAFGPTHKVGDRVYYVEKNNVVECVIVEINHSSLEANAYCFVEPIKSRGRIVPVTLGKLVTHDDAVKMGILKDDNVQDDLHLSTIAEEEDWHLHMTPPEPNEDCDQCESEYEWLYNNIHSGAQILEVLIDFSAKHEAISLDGLLALRDKADAICEAALVELLNAKIEMVASAEND